MAGERGAADPAAGAESSADAAARELAVVLHDVAWLLPRTIGLRAAREDPLPVSELEVMRLLVRRPGLSVNDGARELGMRTLREDGVRKVLSGLSTAEEVIATTMGDAD